MPHGRRRRRKGRKSAVHVYPKIGTKRLIRSGSFPQKKDWMGDNQEEMYIFNFARDLFTTEVFISWNTLEFSRDLGSISGVNEKTLRQNFPLRLCRGKARRGGEKGGGGLSSLDENQTLQTHPPLALPVLPKTGASSHRRRRERLNRMEESMKETTWAVHNFWETMYARLTSSSRYFTW